MMAGIQQNCVELCAIVAGSHDLYAAGRGIDIVAALMIASALAFLAIRLWGADSSWRFLFTTPAASKAGSSEFDELQIDGGEWDRRP